MLAKATALIFCILAGALTGVTPTAPGKRSALSPGTFPFRPLTIGPPPGAADYARDRGGGNTLCAEGDPGYRCFYERNRDRPEIQLFSDLEADLRAIETQTGRVLFDHRATGTGRRAPASGRGRVTAGDVFIRAAGTAPSAGRREWRTIAVAGTEGGLVALDVTSLASRMPPASILWRFDDSVPDRRSGSTIPLDEDSDGEPDLGSHPTATLGRIRLCAAESCAPGSANDWQDRYVAIFGGGLRPTSGEGAQGANHQCGLQLPPRHWLYMVDVENGRTIYKRRLRGAVLGAPTAVDLDRDGVLDRVYAGTDAGLLYRIDLDRGTAGREPHLATVPVRDLSGSLHAANRIPEETVAGARLWPPRVVFDANWDGALPAKRCRPLHHGPAVISVPGLDSWAVAFGSGEPQDREVTPGQQGRFYLFVDDLTDAETAPRTERSLVPVAVGGVNASTEYLLSRPSGSRGWFLALEPGERLAAGPLTLSGVTFFSTSRTDPWSTPPSPGRRAEAAKSRVFVVSTRNGNALLRDDGGWARRFFAARTALGELFSEPRSASEARRDATRRSREPLAGPEGTIVEELKKLFPNECRFASYRVDVKAVAAGTGSVLIAPIPVCLIEQNWREL